MQSLLESLPTPPLAANPALPSALTTSLALSNATTSPPAPPAPLAATPLDS
jgi:hypothetical protein